MIQDIRVILTQHKQKNDLTTGIRPTNVQKIMKNKCSLEIISSWNNYDKRKLIAVLLDENKRAHMSKKEQYDSKIANCLNDLST
jgi:hypothetical protein